jgi:hypothetical protein
MFVEWGKIAPTKTMLAPIGVRKSINAIIVPGNRISKFLFYKDLRIDRGAGWKTFSSKMEYLRVFLGGEGQSAIRATPIPICI